jgi:hypothetical protein
LPHVADWQGLAGDFTGVQPAWARAETGNTNLPAWFKIVSPAGIPNDWQLGDIITHSTDASNGVGSGASNVIWTSPLSGTINISGGVWMGRDIGRGNHWDISLNGASLSGGDIFSGDSFNRASPFQFNAGSGGPAILSQVPIAVGDILQLQITKTSTPGDYAGVNLTITTALSGDYNFDNVVDAADYVTWRKNDGTQAGYAKWRAHFGETLATGTAHASPSNSALPEPTTWGLLLAALLMVSSHRRAAPQIKLMDSSAFEQ